MGLDAVGRGTVVQLTEAVVEAIGSRGAVLAFAVAVVTATTAAPAASRAVIEAVVEKRMANPFGEFGLEGVNVWPSASAQPSRHSPNASNQSVDSILAAVTACGRPAAAAAGLMVRVTSCEAQR